MPIFFLFIFLGQWLFFSASSFILHGNSYQGGLKYLTYYNPKIVNVQPQNWQILQDRRGIIFIANQGGILEYDGVSQRLIDIPNWSVRSMAVDDAGVIYIGGKDEFGYLAPDEQGSLYYVSLLNHLGENQRNFSTVWKTHKTKAGIYFHTTRFLFRWDSRQIKVWQATGNYRFNASFTCGEKLFIRQENLGLMQMVDDSLGLIPGGEIFANKKVYLMTSDSGDSLKMLIGTRYNGFYFYDGITWTAFPTGADDYLKKHLLSHGIRLSSGDFALATLQGGLVIIDSYGSLKQIFNKNSGLPDDNVKYVYEDFQGNLWLALAKGLAKIEYSSGFTLFDHRLNLHGLVLSVIRHKQFIYAGTDRGLSLYSLTNPTIFQTVPGITGTCWFLASVEDSLLVATSTGVFQVDADNERINSAKQILRIISNPSYVLQPSEFDSHRTWVGTHRGLVSLYQDSTTTEKNQTPRWKMESKFDNISQSIRTIVEDKRGNLWLGTLTEGVLYVDFTVPINGVTLSPGIVSGATIYRYDHTHGLPPQEVNVFTAAGHVMFATTSGIFRFRWQDKTFIPDMTFGKEFADGSRGVFRIVEDKNNHIWFHSRSRNFQAIPGPGEPADGNRSYFINKNTFLRIPLAQVNAIYPEEKRNITWFGGTDGLIRYDATIKKNYQQDFFVVIRQVLANGKLIFNGGQLADSRSQPFFPVIAYKDRNLRFSFAAPFFEDESSTQYRCFLEGYDEHWSEWAKNETRKDYTNLDSGRYTFRVQARNVYAHMSGETAFQFRVLPPWTKTWWAFIVYILLFFLLVFLIVRWRSRRLEKEKQILETIVEERTTEINRKNQQLEAQSEKLTELDKIKSRFFTNISHEFRTPLTLIMGPLEQMISKSRSKEQKKRLELMLGNSQRLLTLINQLLDLSKFDSGKMKLQAVSRDVVPFLKGIIDSFRLLAVQNKMKLEFHAQEEPIILFVDPEKLEEVMGNLLSNAIKFTPAGGTITVTVRVSKTGTRIKEEEYLSGFLEISVRDTGIGIPRDQLAHIFDRFYQAEGTDLHNRVYKGSGIGLALSREIVNLHHGRIDVHSREGKGTEFIIRLPMGDRHLKSHEMVSTAEVPEPRLISVEIPTGYLKKREEMESMISRGDERGDESGDGRGDDHEMQISGDGKERNVILVVEDHAEVRDFIRSSLEPDFIVKEAINGREGINIAREIIPDLIISDIMMPIVDGYELCRVLKNDINTSHVPIILLTARTSGESVVQGLETGADDYITKPFNTKILHARIKNLIDLRRQLQLKVQRQKMLLPEEISVSSMDEVFLKDFQEIIEKNLSDPDLNIDQLCDLLYMSRATLFRKVQALTGQSPLQFILSYRLQRAAQLLKANFGNVTEVALEVGFSSPAYFTKRFKEKFHQLPSTFQASESS